MGQKTPFGTPLAAFGSLWALLVASGSPLAPFCLPFGSLLATLDSLLLPFWFPLHPFWLPEAPFATQESYATFAKYL